MKFSVGKDDIAERAALASRITSSSGGGLFVLTGTHIAADKDGVVFTGSDLDQTVRARIAADVEEPGVAVLPARLFTDIIRSLPAGPVTIATNDDEVAVSSGRANFSIRALPAADYPKLGDETDELGEAVELPAADLTAAFHQVARAASNDDARPILTGVRFEATKEGLRLVATDSYRLALRDIAGVKMLESEQSIIVPARGLNEAARLMRGHEKVMIQMGERHIVFAVEDDTQRTQLSCRLIAGDFPAYAPLVDGKDNYRMAVDASELAEVTKRLDMIAKGANAPVRMTVHADRADMTATSHDVGSGAESIDVDFNGETEGLEVAYNPTYLLDGLDAINGETAELWDMDPFKPSLMKSPDDPAFIYLIMPVRT